MEAARTPCSSRCRSRQWPRHRAAPLTFSTQPLPPGASDLATLLFAAFCQEGKIPEITNFKRGSFSYGFQPVATLLNVGLWRGEAPWLEVQNRAKLLISRKTGRGGREKEEGARAQSVIYTSAYPIPAHSGLSVKDCVSEGSAAHHQGVSTKASAQQLLEAPAPKPRAIPNSSPLFSVWPLGVCLLPPP